MTKFNCTKQNENYLLNFFKGLACIGVVFIHFHFPEIFGKIIAKIFHFAVPLFFMIAGFYSYKKDLNTIKRRLIKIAKILFYSLLLYTVYYFIFHCITNSLTNWLISEMKFKSFVNFFILGRVDYAYPLWYLVTMLETYILWFFVVKHNKENLFVRMLPILFILKFISNSYVDTMNLRWYLKCDFITAALTWFTLGYYINANKNYIIQIKNYFTILLGAIGLGIALYPIILKTSINISCIGLFLYAISIFIIGIKYPNKKISNILVYIGKNLSLYIYILHLLIGTTIISLAKTLLKIDIHSTLYTPILIAISTILISYIIDKINLSLKSS
jgi:surface polysaccharide O-acyltransferase-like enzyme